MSIETLEHVVMYGSAQEVINIRCSECGKGLKVAYVPGRKANIGVVCLSCLTVLYLNGVAKEPPWVSELGNKFETG